MNKRLIIAGCIAAIFCGGSNASTEIKYPIKFPEVTSVRKTSYAFMTEVTGGPIPAIGAEKVTEPILPQINTQADLEAIVKDHVQSLTKNAKETDLLEESPDDFFGGISHHARDLAVIIFTASADPEIKKEAGELCQISLSIDDVANSAVNWVEGAGAKDESKMKQLRDFLSKDLPRVYKIAEEFLASLK